MSRHTRVITIPLLEVERIQKFLDDKGKGKVEIIETYTVKFDNPGEWDVRIDIRVCQGDVPYIAVVLFQSGKEVSFLDAYYTLTGEYVFENVLSDIYEVSVVAQESKTVETAARCSCGNTEFYTHQVCRLNIVCDGYGNWIRNSPNDESACYDADNPHGPFTCTSCKKEYEELVVSEWWDMKIGDKINFLIKHKVSQTVALVWIANESDHRLDLQEYIDILDNLNS